MSERVYVTKAQKKAAEALVARGDTRPAILKIANAVEGTPMKRGDDQNLDYYGVTDQQTLYAYDKAILRLRDAHDDEFKVLLVEEFKRSGLNGGNE